MTEESSILREALKAACSMEGVDCAGVYTPEAVSGEYVLSAAEGLPEWFLESFSRLPAEALPELSVKAAGKPEVRPTGVFPMSFGIPPHSYIFTASRSAGTRTGPQLPFMYWLSSMAGAGVRRVRSVKAFRRSMEERSALLERMNDPVFSLNGRMELSYCNTAFRELARLEEPDGRAITFQEASGKDLFGILEERLRDTLATGESSSLVIEYDDRIFSTSIHPGTDGLLVIMRDVTEAETTRRKMDFRGKFESLLVSIAIDFIEMQGSALNLGIHDALLSIGVAIDVDRAYLFQFSGDRERMSCTHEWCASNIQPRVDRLQDLVTADLPWWMNRLHMHETVHIPELSAMPEWAESERRMLEEGFVQSIVAVPIIHGTDLIGFLGFDSVNRRRRWSEEIVDLLRIVGDAIGNALERNRMEKEMMEMYRRAETEAQVNAVLLQEVNHRVKNNLSEIIGLLYAQKRFSSGDYSEFIRNLTGRIRGLATVHDMLSRSGWNPLKLTELARGIVNGAISHAAERKKLTASVSNSSITVDSSQAHALALIINELVRNSIKHALKERSSLRIKVRMRKDRAGRVNLTYSDNGPGYPGDVLSLKRMNLGLDLIQNLISKNLQGRLTLLNDGGAVARIGFSITGPEVEDEE